MRIACFGDRTFGSQSDDPLACPLLIGVDNCNGSVSGTLVRHSHERASRAFTQSFNRRHKRAGSGGRFILDILLVFSREWLLFTVFAKSPNMVFLDSAVCRIFVSNPAHKTQVLVPLVHHRRTLGSRALRVCVGCLGATISRQPRSRNPHPAQ